MSHKGSVCHAEVFCTTQGVIWALLVDWSGLIKWMPDGTLRSLRIEGHGEGAVRHLVTTQGVSISERLDKMDKKTGSLQLSIIEPLPWGMLSYTAHAQLQGISGERCRLTWCGTFELPENGPHADELAALLKKAYAKMFTGLRNAIKSRTGAEGHE